MQKILREEQSLPKFQELNNHEIFERSEREGESCESIEKLKYPPENISDSPRYVILDDLNEKEKNHPRVQARLKRSRHGNFSIFLISHDYYELPKRTIRANGEVYHIFNPNNFRDVQNRYGDKASMDMTPNELIF